MWYQCLFMALCKTESRINQSINTANAKMGKCYTQINTTKNHNG